MISLNENNRDSLKVTTIKSSDDIESLRSIWEKWQIHPLSSIDFYIESLKNDEQILRPAIMLLTSGGVPKCLVLGRLIEADLNFKVGYFKIYNSKARVFSIPDEGILGNVGADEALKIVSEIMINLRSGDADMAHIACIPVDSELYRIARKLPSILCRSYFLNSEKRFLLNLPKTYDAFLERLSSKSRKNSIRSQKKLEKIFGKRITIRHFDKPEEINATIDNIEKVASKSWQRKMKLGFLNTPKERNFLKSVAKHGILSSYFLLIDNEPLAFWYGFQAKNVLYCNTPGYNFNYIDHRIGDYLLMKMIENLCNSTSISTVDFGLGESQYKKVYCNKTLTQSHVRIFSPTLKGIRLNFSRTLAFFINDSVSSLLKLTGIYAFIKRKARK